jgi:hypothetical protein
MNVHDVHARTSSVSALLIALLILAVLATPLPARRTTPLGAIVDRAAMTHLAEALLAAVKVHAMTALSAVALLSMVKARAPVAHLTADFRSVVKAIAVVDPVGIQTRAATPSLIAIKVGPAIENSLELRRRRIAWPRSTRKSLWA